MPEQREFLDRYFVDAGYHKDLIKLIAEECPVPPSVMSSRELDREILDLLPGHVAPVVKATDKQWQTLDKRLTGKMGPLTQLWSALIEARRATPPVQVDVNKMCRLAEQTIIFLGQTHQLVTYSRKQHVLARLVRDNKKANDIIDQNTQVFQMTDDKLFGDAFYQALYRKAKGMKHLREAKRELGFKALRGSGRKRPRLEHQPAATASAWTPADSSMAGPQKPRDGKQPFRGGPPSGPKRGGRGSGKANRYVEVIRTHLGFTTNIRSQTDKASSWYSWWQSGSEYTKLGKDYIRPMGAGNSGRLPDRLGVNPSAGPGAFHPEILGNRMPQSGLGNSENAGQSAITISSEEQGQFVGHLFLRPKKDGSQRPVFNLKPLNKFVQYEHFKMEGMPMVLDLVQGGSWMTKVDLKDAYFSVRIAKKDQKFLKFRWRGSLYQFRSCPFGLASAPRSFTKLLKPAMALLRRSGIQAVIYLDDVILINAGQEMLRAHTETTLWLLEHLGFVVNYDKSQLEPVRQIEYLGFILDTVAMLVQLPPEKVQNIRQKCMEMLSNTHVTVRVLAKLLGKLASTVRAILPGPLHYRQLQMQKTKALLLGGQSYEAPVVLTKECKEELAWWIDSLESWNSRTMIKVSPDLAMQIKTDASKRGWGAVCQGMITQGLLSDQERLEHINQLELKAAFYALEAFTKDMTNTQVHLKVDNRATVAQINKMGGPRSAAFLEVTRSIWEYCMSKSIMLTAEHIPGMSNQEADFQSRTYMDSSNWKLMPSMFEAISNLWGPLGVDWFADRLNAQIGKYVSWKPDPGAWQTDAFTVKWGSIMGYAFPPFCMIGRCLAKTILEQAELVIITPVWQTQPWFPKVLTMLVDSPVLLTQIPALLTSPTGSSHPLMQRGQLCLAAWGVSRNLASRRPFRAGCQSHGKCQKARDPIRLQ